MKTVLITGGTKGLGKSIAYKFASNNYNLALVYKSDKENALKVKEDLISKYNIKVLLLEKDISNEEDVKSILSLSIKEFKTIDVLINNAGISKDNILENKSLEEFKEVLNVNLTGTFLMCKYIGLYMKENKKGSILNISSNNSTSSYYIESIDYDSSKAGINILTKNLASYLSPYVRVNALLPGWINTDMNKNISEEFKKEQEEKILLKRFAEPEEIAAAAYFISSEEGSYFNSSLIEIDGGIK